jgi:hypothetical protein
MKYVWENYGRSKSRNIVFTGGYKGNCRYMKFLKFFNKTLVVATGYALYRVARLYFIGF